jgi:acetyltransferase-like isoleucine patch superfamily enzyme
MIGNFAHVGPGATLAGEITIGAGAFIGAGAVVLPRLSIGEGAIVGAGAVVTKDVPPFTTVIGSPARVLKIAKEWETTCPYCETN